MERLEMAARSELNAPIPLRAKGVAQCSSQLAPSKQHNKAQQNK